MIHPYGRRNRSLLLILSLVIGLATLALPEQTGAAVRIDPAVMRRWERDDGPLANGAIKRTWTWGPLIQRTLSEPYADAPQGQRTVYYLDKARMEINDPAVDPGLDWYVTSGLLVREMVGGRVQLGNNAFAPHPAAQIPVAGDQNVAQGQSITYADLRPVATIDNDHRMDSRLKQSDPVTSTLAPGGKVTRDASLAQYQVHLAGYDQVLGHNVADVFINAIPPDTLRYIAGLPLTEPYWVVVPVGGIAQRVLIQAFQRRVLTYTPANQPPWQVEWGNVGQHYATWRYGATSDGTPIDPNVTGVHEPTPLEQLVPPLVQQVKARQGNTGVAVIRLDSGARYAYGGTQQFTMYSIAKVPIMLTVLDRAFRENRGLNADEQSLVQSMIEVSDNDAATVLYQSVGGADGVNAFLRRVGINDTTMEADAWGSSTTTPLDMARLLAMIDTRTILNDALCAYAIGTMAKVVPDQNWGVSAGTTPQTLVALKNGWYPDTGGWGINSVGIIIAPDKHYAIAVMTFPTSTKSYGVATIEQIAGSVYAAMQ